MKSTTAEAFYCVNKLEITIGMKNAELKGLILKTWTKNSQQANNCYKFLFHIQPNFIFWHLILLMSIHIMRLEKFKIPAMAYNESLKYPFILPCSIKFSDFLEIKNSIKNTYWINDFLILFHFASQSVFFGISQLPLVG